MTLFPNSESTDKEKGDAGMNYESAYLVKVLKCFVTGENPEPFRGDWSKLFQLANIHSVIGILGYTVMSHPDEFDKQVLALMRSQCLQTIALQTMRAGGMVRLIEKMNEEGIDHLLFKGYVLKDYYAVPELRTYGDIDFLIHPEDREKCDALMLREGFQRKTDWEPVYSYYKQAEFYEIHTDVMEVDVSDKADYKGYFQHIWEHAHLVSEHTYELSPEYHFLYILTHIAKHISGAGAGIRMYMDIAVFIQHFGVQLDWDYVQKELETLGFTDFSNMVLTVVRDYFGVDSPFSLKEIASQVKEDFMGYTMAGGVFGHFGREAGLVSLKQQDRNEEEVSRSKTIIRRLFAPASELEKRYTYLQGRHWLYPVAWIHRLIKTRGSLDAHMKEAQSIINTDTEEVLKLKRIYKEIGL